MIFARTISAWRSWWAPVLLIAVGFSFRSVYYHENYGHTDEAITVEVVDYMRRSGDWDTNWAKANLQPGMRYDQYNFSSHLYATYFFYRAVKLIPGLAIWRGEERGFWVYRFFSVALAGITVWQTWWLARRVAGNVAGLFACALVAVMPLLVQDAHYMRPEAFVTMLTLAATLLCLPLGMMKAWRIFAAAVVIGVLVACKVSMLGLAWMPLVPVITTSGAAPVRSGRRLALALALTGLGLGLGFAWGVPGALRHPDVFRHGVEYLVHQYAGAHPPHSHIDGSPVWSLLAGYFRSTLGWPLLAAGAGGVVILMHRRHWREGLLLAGPVILFAGYFGTRSAFFERNLSHVVPLFCVLAGVGAAAAAGWITPRIQLLQRATFPWVGLVLGAIILARPAELTRRLLWIEFSGRGAIRREVFDAKIRAAHPGAEWMSDWLFTADRLDPVAEHFKVSGAGPVLFCLFDYNDEWSAHNDRRLPERFNAQLIADEPSTFADVTGCTLHTYCSWSRHYYLVQGIKTP